MKEKTIHSYVNAVTFNLVAGYFSSPAGTRSAQTRLYPMCGTDQYSIQNLGDNLILPDEPKRHCDRCGLLYSVIMANIPMEHQNKSPFCFEGNLSLAALFYACAAIGENPSPRFDPIWSRWVVAETHGYLQARINSTPIAAFICACCGAHLAKQENRMRNGACTVCGYDGVARE